MECGQKDVSDTARKVLLLRYHWQNRLSTSKKKVLRTSVQVNTLSRPRRPERLFKDHIMNIPTDSPARGGEPAPRHVPPLLLLTFAVLAGSAVLIGAITVLGRLDPPPSLFNLPTVAEATMPDGTILAVHAIREGGTSHDLHFELPTSGGLFGVGRHSQVASFHPHNSRVSIWMTRRHAKTGKSLDFDWWKKSTITDMHGEERQDVSPQRGIYSGWGQSSSSGSRPFPLDTSVDHQGLPRLILVASGFLGFRAGKTFKLKVYNTSDEVVAEFDLPNPVTTPIPEWTPESLPVTKSDGDLSITLKKLTIREHRYNSGEQEQVSWNLIPEISYEQGGQSTTHWYASLSLFDALGNPNLSWSGNISKHESAWKVRATCYRNQSAPFAPNEIIESDWIDVPAKDQSAALGINVKNAAHSYELIRALGPGEVTVTETVGSGTGNYSSNGHLDDNKYYELSFKSLGGTAASMTVKSEWPSVMLRGLKWEENQNITHEVFDEASNAVKHSPGNQFSNYYLIFFKPAPDLKRVKLKTRIQQARVVEFLVSPKDIQFTESK